MVQGAGILRHPLHTSYGAELPCTKGLQTYSHRHVVLMTQL